MVVVIDGHTSKLHACDSKGLALQRCLFRNGYDLGACAWYVSELEKCCHKYQVPCFPICSACSIACVFSLRALAQVAPCFYSRKVNTETSSWPFPKVINIE